MKKQSDIIKKKFDSAYSGIKWDSDFQREIAFGYFLQGFHAGEEVKKAGSKHKEAASLVLDYLNAEKKRVSSNNKLRGIKFTDSIHRLIAARFKEGFTIDDLKQVIDYKCTKWNTPKMWTYVRPSTLFGSKHFAEYLAESDGFKKPVRSETDKRIDELMG